MPARFRISTAAEWPTHKGINIATGSEKRYFSVKLVNL